MKADLRLLLLLLSVVSILPRTAHGQDSKKVDKAMELSGLSVSETFEVADYLPLNPGNAIFRKLFYRVGQTSNENLEAWSKLSIEATHQQLLDQPGKFRFQVFAGTATAHSIDKIELEKRVEGFPNALYVAECISPQGEPLSIVLRQPIGAWTTGQPLATPQPIRYHAFFLGSFESDEAGLKVEEDYSNEQPLSPTQKSTSEPVFIARRIEWLPEAPCESPKVTPSMVHLAARGVDAAGLRDTILPHSAKPLSPRESRLFYRMMRAATDSETMPDDTVSFSKLMRSPKDLIGTAIELQGRIKQCVPVLVNDETTRKTLGADQWYQATLFPDMGGKDIVIRNRSGEDEVYTSFPVTLCLKELPAGLTPKTFEGKSFRVAGYYYRMWIYSSQRTDNSELPGQVSPLVMVSSQTEIQANEAELDLFIALMATMMLIAVIAVGFFVFRSRQPTPGRTEPLPDIIDTNF